MCLNDTQKLGYLLSAIRQERDLNGVYVQLQTDQLRGKVTLSKRAKNFISGARPFERMLCSTRGTSPPERL